MSKRWSKWITLGLVIAIGGPVAALLSRGDSSADAEPQAPATTSNSSSPHKQLWHCGMHPQVVQDHPGNCPICNMALTPINSSASDSSAQRKVLYWWDPMLGPSSISDHPGKSAMGMDMVPVYAGSAGPGVQIDPAVVQNMGVRTAQVTRAALSKTVRTVGLLSLPEPGMHDVSLKIGGWVDKLYADQEGMHVEKGQPLFELYSPDLQIAEQELISAEKSLRSLGPDASAVLRDESRKLSDSARRKLRLWDVDEQDIDAIATAGQPPKDVVFRSPAMGHVEEKMIVQGSSVQAGMKLLRIADHSKMWLDAQVYEEQLSFVKMGQKVTASVDAIPGKTFAGTITFIYPHLDHMNRTLKVRATLDNPDFELKPGMYATADILTQPIADAIVCPREAVIDTGTRQIAFIAEGGGHFSPRKVRAGLAGDDDAVQIVEGLAPGETVVTSGQFLLDVESRTIEATQKLAATPLVSMEQPARPAESQPSLTQIYCPMVKADWLQLGDQVNNPYMGKKMSDCGEVRKKLAAPPAGDPLAGFIDAYLGVEGKLQGDTLDPSALAKLKTAAEKLDPKYGALRGATVKLADAKGLRAARDAFQTVSAQLIGALDHPVK